MLGVSRNGDWPAEKDFPSLDFGRAFANPLGQRGESQLPESGPLWGPGVKLQEDSSLTIVQKLNIWREHNAQSSAAKAAEELDKLYASLPEEAFDLTFQDFADSKKSQSRRSSNAKDDPVTKANGGANGKPGKENAKIKDVAKEEKSRGSSYFLNVNIPGRITTMLSPKRESSSPRPAPRKDNLSTDPRDKPSPKRGNLFPVPVVPTSNRRVTPDVSPRIAPRRSLSDYLANEESFLKESGMASGNGEFLKENGLADGENASKNETARNDRTEGKDRDFSTLPNISIPVTLSDMLSLESEHLSPRKESMSSENLEKLLEKRRKQSPKREGLYSASITPTGSPGTSPLVSARTSFSGLLKVDRQFLEVESPKPLDLQLGDSKPAYQPLESGPSEKNVVPNIPEPRSSTLEVKDRSNCSKCRASNIKSRTRCQVCGNTYCRGCVKLALQQTPEGLKCKYTCASQQIKRKDGKKGRKGCSFFGLCGKVDHDDNAIVQQRVRRSQDFDANHTSQGSLVF